MGRLFWRNSVLLLRISLFFVYTPANFEGTLAGFPPDFCLFYPGNFSHSTKPAPHVFVLQKKTGNTAPSPLSLAFFHIHSKTACRGFKSFCPCHRTGENSGFSPVFFLHVLHGYGVHSGSDTGFSHLVLPVLNRPHPLQHPERTRLRLFSPEIGCVSLFLSSFDLQNFQLCFCASCRIVVTG